MMKPLLSMLMLVMFGLGAGMAGAADPMSEKEAAPSLKERFTNDTVEGTLMRTDGEYYWVKDTSGKEVRLHADSSTKLDKVVQGDKVKAYITDQGHITTLQRDE